MNKFLNWFSEKSPELLLGFGIVGMGTAVVLAVKATPRAVQLLEEAETDVSKPAEVVKTAWKPYIPAAISFAVGMSCVIGSHSIDISRNAALMAAYAVSDTALKEYASQTKKIFGEDADKKIREGISEEKKETSESGVKEVIIRSSDDIYPVKDSITGRVIYTSRALIDNALNEANEMLRNEDFISLNDWYYFLGMKPVYPLGDSYGWNVNDGYIKVDTWETDHTDNGIPCDVMKYSPSPRLGYQFKSEKLVCC